jgi:hypothetical protein
MQSTAFIGGIFMDVDYGLELTNNSKASWAFSMPRSKTCILATEVCKRLCYGNGIRYQSHGQKQKRERNYRTVEFLLSSGGVEALAENLITLVDQVRPSDWLTAKIRGERTRTPWTVRIHDVGDFHTVGYVESWLLTVESRPECSFWFYTRSFNQPALFDAMSKLAALPNCQAWLSIDSENYQSGLDVFHTSNGHWKVALLQEQVDKLPEELLIQLKQIAPGQIVSFPYHRGGHHVEPIVQNSIFVCPAVTGLHRLQSDARKPRPCQTCGFCLPQDEESRSLQR